MGIEPTSSAWKAEVLAVELHPQYALRDPLLKLSVKKVAIYTKFSAVVEGGGFEPPKAEPADLQSAPFDRSGTPPTTSRSEYEARLSIIQVGFPTTILSSASCFIHPSRPSAVPRPGQLFRGARRGTRTPDRLILTYYRFRGPANVKNARVWGLDFLFTIPERGCRWVV